MTRIEPKIKLIRKLKKFAREERMTSRTYERLGYHQQAREEYNHALFFESEIRRLKKEI